MEVIATGILAFVSSNIDDIFLLMLFFGDRNFKPREIILGQFVGIAALIGISLVFSLIGLVIGKAYIGLLGLLPIYLGIKGVVRLFSKEQPEDENQLTDRVGNRSNPWIVSGVTIANGGDNIGIYVPLFATLAWPQKITVVSIFFVMTAVWCLLARYLSRHPLMAKAIDKYGHVVTPFVLIALGIYILNESDVVSLISM
ncbi:cadmium resistance transporter (or sequestration) family protein [Chryseolinea serpens]|uniref:Cadmium resistance transporter (Or sequestration) family protein n=1 Tax=Chryseolinea serpens TaxID=947013 RepID=A0A1M5WSD6_9BACT|nr:cadmium resistance transporter [Chryseolinea serpens]SHH90526.1 cadmium resistance transporter (or sequestration) family protein [Chryseolinea serpens]